MKRRSFLAALGLAPLAPAALKDIDWDKAVAPPGVTLPASPGTDIPRVHSSHPTLPDGLYVYNGTSWWQL